MNAEIIQKKIDDLYYWDARVLRIDCSNFGDEVILVYEDKENGDVQYHFKECYTILFQHNTKEIKIKPINTLDPRKTPYYLHDVKIEKITENNNNLYMCSIDATYMIAKIVCADIDIIKI